MPVPSRGVPSSGDIISTAFGATWNVKLGRVDSGKPDPEGRLPKPDASVKEITVILSHSKRAVQAWLSASTLL